MARFAAAVIRAADEGQMLGVRAGRSAHRIIGIWVVVVDGRIFVRSWGVKPEGWYRTFVKEGTGVMLPMGRKRPIRVRARPVRRAKTLDAVSRAYAAKYHTPGSRRWVRDLCRAKCRKATLELVPA